MILVHLVHEKVPDRSLLLSWTEPAIVSASETFGFMGGQVFPVAVLHLSAHKVLLVDTVSVPFGPSKHAKQVVLHLHDHNTETITVDCCLC